ncbi:MAG: ShlB/FhaC/HecB family hemolysin secretion/activation protein [Gammaproteobacteria bacterium]
MNEPPGAESGLRPALPTPVAAIGAVLLAGTLITTTHEAAAQGLFRPPAADRFDLPPFEPPPAETGSILPPYVPDERAQPATPDGEEALFVSRIIFSGSDILADEDAARIRQSYENRELRVSDLTRIRDETTLLLMERGFLTSGAVIPSQSVADGELEIRIVAGSLARIEEQQTAGYRDGYISGYIEGFGDVDPVNVYDLERRLQVLELDPRTERVEAELLPGETRGESILRVSGFAAPSYRARFEVSNYQNPAIGAWRGVAEVDFLNIAGNGDDLGIGVRVTEGLRELSGQYSTAVNKRDARLAFYGYASDTEIVEDPFNRLDIEAEIRTFGLSYTHPYKRTLNRYASLFAIGEYRSSNSFLLGSGFSFSPGVDDGEAKIAAFRLGWEDVRRNRSQVIATRVIASVGVDALDATTASGDIADGQFFAILARTQWARRFGFMNGQLLARFDGQITDRALLGLEQFGVGGHRTVRGYRENTLIRDNGVVASAEYRATLWSNVVTGASFEAGPFVDYGYSWNTELPEIGEQTLASVGVVVRWLPLANLRFDVAYGYALTDVRVPGENNLQDDGFHVGAFWEVQ